MTKNISQWLRGKPKEIFGILHTVLNSKLLHLPPLRFHCVRGCWGGTQECWVQCCGSMTFWCGSGSGYADPCLWLVDQDLDMDPNPAILVINLQDANKKLFLKKSFSACWYFLKVRLQHFSKIKVKKKSQNSRNQSFSYYFCLMIEGPGSGSIHFTRGSGSGSRRTKNIWIRWIRIRIRSTGYVFGISGQTLQPLC